MAPHFEDFSDFSKSNLNNYRDLGKPTTKQLLKISLIEMVAEITGFDGQFVWDGTKPDGQPRRILDTSRAFIEFGFRAKTSLEEGLKKTVDWYKKRICCTLI